MLRSIFFQGAQLLMHRHALKNTRPAAEPPGSLSLIAFPGFNERITFDREELPADNGEELLRQRIHKGQFLGPSQTKRA
jgi:hypothetical protein